MWLPVHFCMNLVHGKTVLGGGNVVPDEKRYLVRTQSAPLIYAGLSGYLESISHHGPPLSSHSLPSKLAPAKKPEKAKPEKAKKEEKKEEKREELQPLVFDMDVEAVETLLLDMEAVSEGPLLFDLEVESEGPLLLDMEIETATH